MSLPSKTLLIIGLAVFLILIGIFFVWELYKEGNLSLGALWDVISTAIIDLLNWQNTFPYWV